MFVVHGAAVIAFPEKADHRGIFGTDPWEQDWDPRYNIAPTQPIPIIRQHPLPGRNEPAHGRATVRGAAWSEVDFEKLFRCAAVKGPVTAERTSGGLIRW